MTKLFHQNTSILRLQNWLSQREKIEQETLRKKFRLNHDHLFFLRHNSKCSEEKVFPTSVDPLK